jgi:general transcription factor 3C polypeptide 3 (transcription factor C subunit 4)
MRMLKVMDFALLDEKDRSTFRFTDGNRVAWTEGGKGDGNPYSLKAHDPNLLGLYAHMMSIADSSAAALNYYYRAYVLKPDDPLLNLCIGLSYLSFAFKRQSHNRQFHLQQGLTFLTNYYELRAQDDVAIHLQEAEFNMGMAWQALGLSHLALPAYEKCMLLSGRVQEEGGQNRGQRGDVEDFAAEAAFAMQSILAMNGDAQAARNITKQWLVI